jgi:hypothetical protein
MSSKKRAKPPTAFEREVLAILLSELRRAMRMRGQLHVTIDPFVGGDGTYIFASPNTSGRTYELAKGRRR